MEPQKAKKKGGGKDKQKKSKSNKSEQNEDKKGSKILKSNFRGKLYCVVLPKTLIKYLEWIDE